MASNESQLDGEDPSPLLSASVPVTSELRLVLLGQSGSGKSSAGNLILGKEEFVSLSNSRAPVTQECEIQKATVAGRQVTVVDTPDWVYSEHPLSHVQHQISRCMALSHPGPHAFLLCVPVDRPGEEELQALEAVARVFGAGAVESYTLVVFTHSDRLGTPTAVEEYVVSRRADLTAVTERCGGRHHVLEREGGAGQDSVRALLAKVDAMVTEAGGSFYSCPPLQEEEGEEKEESTVRLRQGSGGTKGEEEAAAERDDPGQRSRGQDDDSGDELSPDTVAARNVSLTRSIWETLIGFLQRIPRLLRLEALMGGLVSLFVGGPVGSALGATVGSVAMEVGKRKNTNKK